MHERAGDARIERRFIMTMRKIIAIIIVASILSGCGANAAPSKPETAVEADTSEAAQADTAPNQTTVVVWLDKGDVIVIEEYGDHYTVTNSDGSSEYPKSLPHIEESKCEYSELPGEWQEALSTSN